MNTVYHLVRCSVLQEKGERRRCKWLFWQMPFNRKNVTDGPTWGSYMVYAKCYFFLSRSGSQTNTRESPHPEVDIETSQCLLVPCSRSFCFHSQSLAIEMLFGWVPLCHTKIYQQLLAEFPWNLVQAVPKMNWVFWLVFFGDSVSLYRTEHTDLSFKNHREEGCCNWISLSKWQEHSGSTRPRESLLWWKAIRHNFNTR